MRTRSHASRPHVAGSRRRPSAFTLIEVLLVLIILVILGSLAANVFTGTQDKANIKAASVQVGMVKKAIGFYRLDMNSLPERIEDLWEPPEDEDKEKNWNGPYAEELPEDPWGNPYQYSEEGEKNTESFDVWSFGPDGEDGTEDDIGNWKDDDEV